MHVGFGRRSTWDRGVVEKGRTQPILIIHARVTTGRINPCHLRLCFGRYPLPGGNWLALGCDSLGSELDAGLAYTFVVCFFIFLFSGGGFFFFFFPFILCLSCSTHLERTEPKEGSKVGSYLRPLVSVCRLLVLGCYSLIRGIFPRSWGMA